MENWQSALCIRAETGRPIYKENRGGREGSSMAAGRQRRPVPRPFEESGQGALRGFEALILGITGRSSSPEQGAPWWPDLDGGDGAVHWLEAASDGMDGFTALGGTS
jgi:hypothetical protein